MTAVAFPDGFDFSEGWKKHVEESDKKARDLLESYYKKCQEKSVSMFQNYTMEHSTISTLVQFQKKSVLPSQKVFVLHPPLPPGNSGLSSYSASKILALKTPLPLGISNDLPWGGIWMIYDVCRDIGIYDIYR